MRIFLRPHCIFDRSARVIVKWLFAVALLAVLAAVGAVLLKNVGWERVSPDGGHHGNRHSLQDSFNEFQENAASCAACHMTGYRKNYHIATDSYQSRWNEMGVSCTQCHGDMKGHSEAFATPPYPEMNTLNARQVMDNCASCHSRREELDPGFFRAWYNLGLLQAGQERLNEAVLAISRAAETEPENPLAPYVLATLHLRMGDEISARQAAENAVAIDPNYQPARQLLEQIRSDALR